jgi:hypothetical protein
VANLPLERTPGQTTFTLQRLDGEAPIADSAGNQLLLNWNSVPQPVEFDWPLNPSIDKIRSTPTTTAVSGKFWLLY